MRSAAAPFGIVAITGATGFIGGRLAELLMKNRDAIEVRVLTRRRSKDRNARVVNLDDETEVREALRRCQAVVHCAFDFHEPALNIQIARNLIHACLVNKTRLVYLSSWAVYSPLPDGDLSEDWGISRGGDDYKNTKIAIEQLLLRSAQDDGLDVVILQPTIVYGPFGGAWTDSPVRELLTGCVALPDMGEGICNAVYVDDVCQAIVSALRPQLARGQRFLISGPKPVAWRDFLGAYEEILDVRSLRYIAGSPRDRVIDSDSSRLAEMSGRPGWTRLCARVMTAIKRAAARHIGVKSRARLNFVVKRLVRRFRGETVLLPNKDRLSLYCSRARVRIDHAKRELGYDPQFDLARGMAATAPYLRRAYPRGKSSFERDKDG